MTTAADNATIASALAILERRMTQQRAGHVLDSPNTVRNYLTLRYADQAYESFGCIFVDAQNRIIRCVDLFRGTLKQTTVYPREVVRAALDANAAAVILFHNHPSGTAEPSGADRMLTDALRSALTLVDIRVLDHLIVAGMRTYSFAEYGLI